jgi:serine/threonine protein kinase
VSEGLSFGAYRVVRKLGQGGMGAVYLGEHTLIGRRAAIKVLQHERSSQRENVERFFTEARATSAVEDPGIVQIYDFGVTTSGTAYLVMEYLDGEALSARLRRLTLLTPHHALRIARQVAGSLASAHALGIVHRDLKPENLFLVRDGEASAGERCKILDFGIAKLGDEGRERFQTRTGSVMGTPAYMSPEQCNDTGKIDHRTDIYSLGCVLFHLLTGRPPFDVDGVGATIAAHLKETAPPPSSLATHVPPSVDPLVARCLAKRPEDRFSSMLELQQACDAVLAQLPPEPTVMARPVVSTITRPDATTTLGTSVGQTTASGRPIRRGMWVAASAVAVAAGILLAVMTTEREAPAREGTSSSAIVPASSAAPESSPTPVETGAPAAIAPSTNVPLDVKADVPADVPAGVGSSGTGSADPAPAGSGTMRPSRKSVPKKRKPAGVGLYEDRI